MTRDPRTWRGAATALLWTLSLLALVAALLHVQPPGGDGMPSVLVLVDRSDSVPRAAADRALSALRGQMGLPVQVLEFAGRVAAPGTAPADPQATDIESALRAALARHVRAPLDRLVVVSDGHETRGQAEAALRELVAAGLRPQWVEVSRPPPAVQVAAVQVPPEVQVGQAASVQVQLASPADRPLRLRLAGRVDAASPTGATAVMDAGARAATLSLPADRAGALRLDLEIDDAASGELLARRSDAAVVGVRPRAPLLYVQGGRDAVLADSLQQGGWPVQRVRLAELDGLADGLAAWQAVVLDEVALADAVPRFWQALERAVRDQGLGLMVVGGERAFAQGGYRGSVLEGLLPVRSEPAALNQPTSVLFAVDKSGSMGEGRAGVDRFAAAQRAVLETARGLAAADRLGLLAFDTEPRLLLQMQPVRDGLATLARDWPVAPRGGTRLAPALEAALDELEREPAGHRLLVLVTDGFVADPPLEAAQQRLAALQVQTVALAVGPDADVDRLERLFGPPAGQVLRVTESAELPQRMRLGVERLRARVERGPVAVESAGPLPFEPHRLQDWPRLDAYAVTQPQPGATVAVQSARGDPVIAHHAAGRGRVLAMTTSPGAWASAWLRWRQWPSLAGGLATWLAPPHAGEPLRLGVHDEAGGLVVEVQALTEPAGPGPDDLRLLLDTPTEQGREVPLQPLGPGRWQAQVPAVADGLSRLRLVSASGTQSRWHLRRPRLETESVGISPMLSSWRAAGLVDGPSDAGPPGDRPKPRRPDAGTLAEAWLVWSLGFFVAGLLVDRWPGWLPRRVVAGAALRRVGRRLGDLWRGRLP